MTGLGSEELPDSVYQTGILENYIIVLIVGGNPDPWSIPKKILTGEDTGTTR